jgi:hypothetical protein
MAKGGVSGGGGVPAPPAACSTIDPLNSGVIDKPASRKPITVDFKLTNCTDSAKTLTTTLVGTSTTVTSLDPFVVSSCPTAPYSAQRLTLKPGESRTISAAAQLPYCGYSPWGLTVSYDVAYDATVRDLADGTELGSATSYVLHRGGV